MWAIDNQTPFAADRAFVRDRDGAEIWLVAVRATYEIRTDGSLQVADDQVPVARAPVHFGEPPASSLRYETDLVRTKLATDVILNASAYAPPGRTVREATVGFSVGPIRKQLTVVGDHAVKAGMVGLKGTDPEPFTSLPIVYERAYGGTIRDESDPDRIRKREDANPVGVGLDATVGSPLPNVALVGDAIRPKARIRPAGFGAIAAHWMPRVRLAGTYDAKWAETRQPLVPEDFDDGHFQCAPADQQVPGFLRGGEEVRLMNLSPEGLLTFKLPRLTLGFSTRIDGGITHHRASLHTVIIEPDERRVIMVWHTALPCHHSIYTLKETVIFEKERVAKATA